MWHLWHGTRIYGAWVPVWLEWRGGRTSAVNGILFEVGKFRSPLSPTTTRMWGLPGSRIFSVCLCMRASVIAGIPWFLIDFWMAAERSKTSGYGALFMWGKSVVCHDWKSDGIRQVFKVVLEAWQIRDAPWKCKNGKCSVGRRFLTFFSPKRSTFGVFESSKEL